MYTEKSTNDLINHYIAQIYKMLGLFEQEDINGFKYGIRILNEMEKLPRQFPVLYGDYRFRKVLIKVDCIVDELFFLDKDNHQLVKNHAMESMNLLEAIKEVL